jgi:hypothetical protein
MRRTILTLASLAALIAVASPAAQAHPANDRYCLQGRMWGYPGNCQFTSYQQCQATASGTSAYCGVNPRYAFSQQCDYGRVRGVPPPLSRRYNFYVKPIRFANAPAN